MPPLSYTRRPPQVTAMQFDQQDPTNCAEILAWAQSLFADNPDITVHMDEWSGLWWTTVGTDIAPTVGTNNYLVKDANGNVFVQDQSSFEAMYYEAPVEPEG